MLSGNGLLSSSEGARIAFDASGSSAVAPVPFAIETLISGYWILDAKGLQEAVEWAGKAPLVTLGVRKVSVPENFGGQAVQ